MQKRVIRMSDARTEKLKEKKKKINKRILHLKSKVEKKHRKARR